MTNTSRQTFETALERVRGSFDLCVYGYVVMPEHVHLLTGEPQHQSLADALKSLKQGVSRRLIGELSTSGKSAITTSISGISDSSQKSFATFIAIQ
jgi:REP element-mobilizing transposase RayT